MIARKIRSLSRLVGVRKNARRKVVGGVRFELTTSCTRNKRATRLRYAPPTKGAKKCTRSLQKANTFLRFFALSEIRDCQKTLRQRGDARAGFGGFFEGGGDVVTRG